MSALDATTEAALCDYRAHQERRGLRVGSIAKTEKNLRGVAAHMQPSPLLTMTSSDVAEWLEAHPGTLNTKYGLLSCLHVFFTWAVLEHRAEVDPTLGVERPRYSRPMADGRKVALRRASGALLAGFEQAQRRRGIAASTIHHRHGRIRLWLAWLAPNGAADATPRDVHDFLDGRRLTNKTRYGWLSTLHAFYRWMQQDDPDVIDPTGQIERPRFQNGLPRPIATPDLAALLEGSDPRQRAALILAAYAGMRVGEIAHLERDWIDQATGIIRIMGKGSKERIVDLHPIVVDALRAIDLPRAGRIFRYPDGSLISPPVFARHLNDHLKQIVPGATMHQLRHWFATEAYRATKDLRAVQELMGHASPTTTAIYTKLDRSAGRAAVLALPVVRHQPDFPAP